MKKSKLIQFGQIIFGIVVLLFFIYLFFHLSELKTILNLLVKLKWYYFIPLILLEFLFLLNRGKIFSILFNKLNIKINLWPAFESYLAFNSLNALVPSAGFSGITVFLSQAEKHSVNKSKIFLLNLLYYFISYISLAVILVFSLIYLFSKGQYIYYYLSGFIILLLIIFFWLILFLIISDPKTTYSPDRKIIKFINIFLKWLDLELDEQSFNNLLIEARLIKKTIKKDVSVFWIPFFLFFLGFAFELIMLSIIFYIFDRQVPLIPMVMGYSFGIMFMLVSITPSGVGIVEPIMTFVFASFGISLESSALIVLLFRAITFWLPLPVGTVLMRRIMFKPPEKIVSSS